MPESGRGDVAKKRKEAQRQPRDEEHIQPPRKKQKKDSKPKISAVLNSIRLSSFRFTFIFRGHNASLVKTNKFS